MHKRSKKKVDLSSLSEKERLKHHLNDQQCRFCEHYVENGGNGFKAAISAGYAKRSADNQVTRFFKMETIHNYIEYLRKKMEQQIANRVIITRVGQIEKLERIYDNMIDNKSPGHQKVAIEAMKEQHKLLALYEPEKSIVKNEISFSDSELDDEIDRLLGK